MIKYLEHKEIDFVKYDKCISGSENTFIYAYSWYLDIVAKNWDVLVFGDYEIVMPLTHRKKYDICYLFLPAWVQQLGVFSANSIQEDLIRDFINAIPRKFRSIDILFNNKNIFSSNKLEIRNNYILDLNRDYKLLYKKFTKGRKSNIKQSKKFGLLIKETDNLELVLQMFCENKGRDINKPEKDYETIRNVVSKGLLVGKVKIYEVFDSESVQLGGAIFLMDNNRITFLFSAVNQNGRDKQAISFLIDFIIEKYAGQELILDFEGSMIKGIADFFKSFGAIRENYYWYRQRFLF
jgi:hypothetical protein